MDEILLRPHHALCIRFFEGKGYSSEFTRHMAGVIEKLQEPGQCVALVDEEDEICKKCPNHLENGCSQKRKVQRYDENVIDMTGLSYGERIEFGRLKDLTESRIMAAGRFRDLCGDCGWASICHKKQEE